MIMFCKSLTKFSRRETHIVNIGKTAVGGDNPLAVQSMTNTDTNDVEASVNQIITIKNAGGHIVRLTAQGDKEAEALAMIASQIKQRQAGDVALVADIHFKANAAQIAAKYVDKVRINPGNYAPTADAPELKELIKLCKERGVALRIGVNHGSLSARMVEKYGDTPQGMVASAMEYLRACLNEDFNQIVVSMKSSNVRVMVQAYRMLVSAMNKENMTFPLHLGVTEAGDGSDARIKSAAGLGALLSEGIGDTLRVSLTENPENEIPVGQAIVDYYTNQIQAQGTEEIVNPELYSPYEYKKRESNFTSKVPLLFSELSDEQLNDAIIIEAPEKGASSYWRSAILNLMSEGDKRAVIIKKHYSDTSLEQMQLKAAYDMGVIFLDGLADGIYIDAPAFSQEQISETALSILQAVRVRMSKTEYIACPGCGRTQYNLQESLQKIKAKTSHLTGLKIGVMGCIVNGPGEMADADYGYVGSGKGKITLYKAKEVVKRNIEQDQAVDALIELIRSSGDWKDKE
ncbi:MAG: (E)-4-hydroxy-3-methylbut-2-enyl-diphosphate synthase [Rikenellaceae bacterium]